MRRALIVLLGVAITLWMAMAVAPAPGATEPSQRAEVAGKGKKGKGGKSGKRAKWACPRLKGEPHRAHSHGKKHKKSKKRRARYCSSGGEARADFNGDGFADLAVGVPGEDVGGKADAGAVNVIYGSASGLTAAGDQFWHQDKQDILDAADNGDIFGLALAAGDFNGDGFADLAAGVPGEDVGGKADAGAVNVIFGSSGGLTPAGNQLWHQDSEDIEGVAKAGDAFGSSLAWANFGFNDIADLAVGVPSEDSRLGVKDIGAVNVIYGSFGGLTPSNDSIFTQDTLGVPDDGEELDKFGSRLAGGDFDGNGFADLAVGIPFEDIPPAEGLPAAADAGAVNVIYGSLFGVASGETAAAFSAPQSQFLRQGAPREIRDFQEAGDQFGFALAAGDVEGDADADLAIGVPGEDVRNPGGATVQDTGAVDVIEGSGAGLSPSPVPAFLLQPSADSPSKAGDNFGRALALANLNALGGADLAVGVPGANIEGLENAGAVHVIYAPLGEGDQQFWHQNQAGVPDVAEAEDGFGLQLSSWDFNNDTRRDLAVGVPAEDVGGSKDAGAANVLYSAGTIGLRATGSQFWHQDRPGILDTAEASDFFGLAVY